MAEQDTDESKPHEPTAKKLQKAREKGDIPRSSDTTSAVAYGGFFLALAFAGAHMASGLGDLGTVLISQAGTLAELFFDGHGTAPARAILADTGRALTPLFAVPIVLVIGILIAQRGIVFAPEKLKPKLSRISLISNAKQKFGLSGLFEFAKSFVKLCVFSVALGVFLWLRVEQLMMSATLPAQLNAVMVGRLALEFLAVIVVIAGLIAVVDWIWQVADYRRRNRMSHKELQDELKETEGDPLLKDKRRQKGMAIAQSTMLADVPKAAVVIVNPTHYAVALKWEMGDLGAPVCLAKGVDEIALRIREAATEASVPIHEDPPTARALFATLEVGQEIASEHFVQVAAAIRFAEAVRAKSKASFL